MLVGGRQHGQDPVRQPVEDGGTGRDDIARSVNSPLLTRRRRAVESLGRCGGLQRSAQTVVAACHRPAAGERGRAPPRSCSVGGGQRGCTARLRASRRSRTISAGRTQSRRTGQPPVHEQSAAPEGRPASNRRWLRAACASATCAGTGRQSIQPSAAARAISQPSRPSCAPARRGCNVEKAAVGGSRQPRTSRRCQFISRFVVALLAAPIRSTVTSGNRREQRRRHRISRRSGAAEGSQRQCASTVRWSDVSGRASCGTMKVGRPTAAAGQLAGAEARRLSRPPAPSAAASRHGSRSAKEGGAGPTKPGAPAVEPPGQADQLDRPDWLEGAFAGLV